MELALKALACGDRVIVTSRSLGRLDHLKAKGAAPVRLDHNQSFEHVKSAVKEALGIYKGVDIIVNNAAYVQTGMLEEATYVYGIIFYATLLLVRLRYLILTVETHYLRPEETLLQFQSNVFGPLNVYRAILPHFREKRSGVLATVGSMAAWYPMAGCNLYDASKAAMRMIGIGLQGEVAAFGIKHCLIEPGFFRTELLNPTANLAKTTTDKRLPDYGELNAANDKNFAEFHGQQLGNPVKGGEVVYDVLTSSGVAAGRDVPPFLPLGSDAVGEISKHAQETIDQVKEWEKISSLTDFPAGQ